MSTAEETAQALLAILPLINRRMVAQLRRESTEETTMPQFRVLGYLAKEVLTPSDIARRRHVSLQAAGLLIQSLVERGWVMRVPDPNDRRQTHLHLTEAGLRQYQQAHRRMQGYLIPLMEQLTPEEISAVQVALHALERVLTTEDTTNDGE